MSDMVQKKGNFWGGRDGVPAETLSWSRAGRLLTAEGVRSLVEEGMVVIDGAVLQLNPSTNPSPA